MKENMKHQQKQRQRLGSHGGALSLDAFVKAKSRPRLNPSDIKKKREYYENAKKVKKYKVMVKHLPQQQQRPIAVNSLDDGVIAESKDGNGVIERKDDSLNGNVKMMSGYQNEVTKYRKLKPKKRKNALESVREEYVKKKQEEEREKEEREKARKLKEENQAKAWQKRKELKSKMFKKTQHGQPLMKHRLEHILDTIQQQN